eukprot:353445-Chlamydomonas_euryale.AAC.32
MSAPVYGRGRARRGPTLHECVLLHAVSRLVLFPAIPNIQVCLSDAGRRWPAAATTAAGPLMPACMWQHPRGRRAAPAATAPCCLPAYGSTSEAVTQRGQLPRPSACI